MFKSVFIIEAKLTSDKTQQVNQYLETSTGYEKTDSCVHADYIVTELKSSSRIMRFVKKSTCPVVHVTWLLESIRLGNQLDPHDYLIDVSEARKQLENDISARIADRALPRQLTWDQVALRRLNRENFENNSHLARNAGLRERARFSISYGSRLKSSERTSLSRTSLLKLQEKKVSSINISVSSAGSPSYIAPVGNPDKDASLIKHHITQYQKDKSPSLLNGGLLKKPTGFHNVCNDSEINVTFAPLINDSGESSNGNAKEADSSVSSCDTVIIRDDIFDKNVSPTKLDEIIFIGDDSENDIVEETASNNTDKDLNDESDQGFSIFDNQETSTSQDDNEEDILCSSGKVINSSNNSPYGNEPDSKFEFNCSSISSLEFDTSSYSLSAILSL
ncbi:hypothetical protein INT47_002102 [Mucor saturninus]|uniref:BRCT domain-containing protein n=1 Tax=Mucor saturninus TaxID=64648 RepID=A0A8H7V0J6_9FUNG|nr:hypothetical protein INT47_002102 [Mucor saturninus]